MFLAFVLPYQCEQRRGNPDAAGGMLSYTNMGGISIQDNLQAFHGAFSFWQSSVQQL